MATDTAHSTFAKFTNHSFPVNLFDLINKIGNIQIVTYYELAEELEVSVDYVINKIGRSTDGFTLNRGKQFIIVYNSDTNTNIVERIRYTIAHEIGHIVMGHFNDDDTILRRGGLDSKQYDVLEKEAETFAHELLIPTYIIDTTWSSEYIQETFDVSKQVANNSLETKEKLSWIKPTKEVAPLYFKQKISLKKRKLLYYSPTRDQHILKKNILFLTGKKTYFYCQSCHNVETINNQEINFCPICGSYELEKYDDQNYIYFHETKERYCMTYSELKVDKEGRLIENCPICGNDHVSNNFCSVCGVSIINKCSGLRKIDSNWDNGYEEDMPCEGPLLGSDRYCPKCGAESTFYNNNLLKDWNFSKNEPNFLVDFDPFDKTYNFDVSEDSLPF